MKPVEVSIEIKAGVEAVFEAFSNLEKVSERVTDIVKLEKLTDGPMGLGTRWRETRVMFGKESSEEMEITAFTPSQSYTAEAESHGSHYTSSYRFEPINDGTRVTMTFHGQALTFVAKVMSFLMGPMMKGAVTKCMAKDMTELKDYLESGQAVS